MKNIMSVFFTLFLFAMFSTVVIAQSEESKISLLDFEDVKDHLALNDAQVETIKPSIEEIRELVREDEEMRIIMRGFREGGERPDREVMMKMREEREERAGKLESLVEKIKRELTKEQKQKFDDIDIPDLTMQRRVDRINAII